MFRFRDREVSSKVIEGLKAMELDIRVMHVCGGHQDTLVRYGLDSLLKNAGVDVRQGPGCPVCVTPPEEIEEVILLAKRGKVITVFGDMMRVPGEKDNLFDMRSKGGDIKMVYSIDDAVEYAKENKGKEIVFMAIGFETTAPSTASAILEEPPENFTVLNTHRIIPPALKALIEMGEIKLDGFIEPGHVSTIIGTKPYEFISKEYKIPQVIAGFEPLDLLIGIYLLARQIKGNEAKIEIEYKRVVREEGNPSAVRMLNEVFEECDVSWRGFGVIPKSGLKFRRKFERYDARKVYEDELSELEGKEFKEPKGCRCGEVLRGVITSKECPLFGKVCTPKNPVGPCMVTSEGSCNIMLKYRR